MTFVVNKKFTKAAHIRISNQTASPTRRDIIFIHTHTLNPDYVLPWCSSLLYEPPPFRSITRLLFSNFISVCFLPDYILLSTLRFVIMVGWLVGWCVLVCLEFWVEANLRMCWWHLLHIFAE